MRVLVVALLLASAPSLAQANVVELTVVVDKTSFYRGEPVAVWVLARNSGKRPIFIGSDTQQIEVRDEHNELLPYTGEAISRVSTGDADERVLQPGESRVLAAVELDSTNAGVMRSGVYHLRATAKLYAHTPSDEEVTGSTGAMKPIASARSDAVVITVSEITDPAEDILAKCNQGGWLGCINDYFVRHRGEPPRPRAQLTEPSILDPYIALVKMQSLERPRDLRQWRESFMKRFPQFDQPGLLWASMANSTDRYKLKELDTLLLDAVNDPAMARHPALLVMKRRQSLLLDELKESTQR